MNTVSAAVASAPTIVDWNRLDGDGRRSILARPARITASGLLAQVRQIVERVRAGGDAALRELTRRFDGVELSSIAASPEEFRSAAAGVGTAERHALERAIENVRRFHVAQMPVPLTVETMRGISCERLLRPIDPVGLYVPAGNAPLPSTVVMLAVPARIAGCTRRVLCTPPRPDGSADPAVLLAAELCGVTEVLKVGGAQAIAAMAYGTESVPKVAKIFGPGNAWVTAAKQLVAPDADGAAVDLPAGPSEVLVIADDSAHPAFVAADLLAQAEHGPDSQAMLVTDSPRLATEVAAEIASQVRTLSRCSILAESVAASRIIVVADLRAAFDISNTYAPEHLILHVRESRDWLAHVQAAGSVFLGPWSPEPLGDYCSGTNHVLPTGGHARAHSGLSVLDFLKRITVQEATPEGLKALGPTAITLAQLEGLDAHAAAVRVRLEELSR